MSSGEGATPLASRAGRAAIVAVGNEVTEGRTLNTNATRLSVALNRLGFETVLHVAVRDVHEDIVRALREASARAQVVLVSGGLGPTVDDITRDAAAALAGAPLVEHDPSWEWITTVFRALGREPQANNRRQALFPAGAEVLPNPIGTAPGFRLGYAGAALFFLPGIPRELDRMFDASVRPALEGELRPGALRRTRRLNAFGAPESEADAALGARFADGPVRLGFNVSSGILEVHLTAEGDDAGDLERVLADGANFVRAALGHRIYGEGEGTLAHAVLDAARARGVRLGLAESCTGGLAARELVKVPGASDVLAGGVVAYANAVKERLLGVPAALLAERGAVSEEVALAMAEGALEALGCDLAASVTGVAGPDGGTPEKPVGTVWIAVAGRPGPAAEPVRWARCIRLRGERAWIQRLAALSALEGLRRALLGVAKE